MLVWWYITLCAWITCCTFAREFRLGMMSPYKHVRLGWTNNAAAATMAIEQSQSEGLLQGHNITVIWRDDKCNALGGAGNAVHLKEVDGIDAFIGPPCSDSTTPSGLLASYWNLPMFSHASSDPSLADKKVYNTLVRLGPPFNRLGQALVEIFHHYNWNRVFMISRRKTDNRRVFCDYSSRAADVIFPANNITVAEWMIIDDGIDDIKIDDMLHRIQQRGRIVLLCTENVIDRRKILLKAKIAGMMDGNYVFWTSDHLPATDVKTPWIKNDTSDNDAKLAFSHVLQITVAEMAGPDVEAFRDMIPIKMAESPWFYNNTARQRGSLYSPFLHDVVYLYLLILNETLALGEDHRNGTAFFHKAQGKTFKGITGNVKVDSNGDREPDYWVWDLTPNSDEFIVALEARMTSSTEKIRIIKEIVWSTVDGKPPLDEPLCGFSNERCPSQTSTIVVWVSVMMLLSITVLLIVAYFVYRHRKLERELDRKTWIIDEADLKLIGSKRIGSLSTISLGSDSIISLDLNGVNRRNSVIGETQIFCTIGVYRTTMVTVKKLSNENTSLRRKQHMQLKLIKELSHENVNRFIGVCIASKFPCYLTVYCSKGSIQDIVENDDIKLDWVFKQSIITDLTNGLHYLHSSPLKVHGNLKSSNCVVDNRWVLKLTDFGLLDFMHQNVDPDDPQSKKAYFWTAPEVLRHSSTITAKCDIYSLGIILYEILNRTSPYDTNSYTPNEIVEKIINLKEGIFRPSLTHSELSESDAMADFVIKLMQDCWSEIPEQRPHISSIKQSILKLNRGKRVNIVDNMIILLERYANNLEQIVEQRTSELIQERRKSDLLLCRMLPPSIADKLKKNETVLPEMYESVTIYFSDIVGFTLIAADSTAMQIVDLLNDLYTIFDFIISKYEVYKIETIGDAYMVASGLPERNGDKHVTEIAEMALDLVNQIQTFTIRHLPDKKCQIRIGLHTGPCAAGVVGLIMPRYCLFGDTVNMASRMESNGEASKIHISESTADNLQRHGVYNVIARGDMDIKGKGRLTTYWLVGRNGENNVNSANKLTIEPTQEPVPVQIDV